MNIVWIKLNSINGNVVSLMFGTGGIIAMHQNDSSTGLFNAGVHVDDVIESVDEIMQLIGSVRNGVQVSAPKV